MTQALPIGGAMITEPPKDAGFFWAWGRMNPTTSRATDLMVHLPRLGPRRVYLRKRTGAHYVVIGRRRRRLTEEELAEARRQAGRSE